MVSVQRMVKLSAVWRVFGGESCSGRSFLFTSVIIAQRSRTGHDGFHIDLQQRDKEREAGCTTNQQGEKIKIYSELIKTSFRSINLVFYFPHEHCDNQSFHLIHSDSAWKYSASVCFQWSFFLFQEFSSFIF